MFLEISFGFLIASIIYWFCYDHNTPNPPPDQRANYYHQIMD